MAKFKIVVEITASSEEVALDVAEGLRVRGKLGKPNEEVLDIEFEVGRKRDV